MIKFRISLNLHNFNNIHNKKYSKSKTTTLLKFYKTLAKTIRILHNNDIKQTRRQFKEYYEPSIVIKRNIFTVTSVEEDNPISTIIDKICPPTIDIDVEFRMKPEHEKAALKQYHKEYEQSVKNMNMKNIRTLYYSTKITHFMNRLRCLIDDNVFWDFYKKHNSIKTKYAPIMSISNVAVLSLI
jgi:hypothetical protein